MASKITHCACSKCLSASLILDRIKHNFQSRESIIAEYHSIRWPGGTRFLRQHGITLRTWKISKWSRGKLYCTEGNRIFLVPTNDQTLNYLNLEEFVFNCDAYLPPPPENDRTRRYIEANTNHNPLVEDVEDFVLRHYFGDYLDNFQDDIEEITLECCDELIHRHILATLLPLLRTWEPAKYVEFLQKFLHPARDNLLSYSDVRQTFLEVLVASSTHSPTVAKIMPHLVNLHFGSFGVRAPLLEYLPNYYYVLFCCHLQRANLKYSPFEKRVGIPDILSLALQEGNVEIMKLGLELEYSSGYPNPAWLLYAMIEGHSMSSSGFPVVRKVWPRRKYRSHPSSFHSVEFYAAFAYITAWAASVLDDSHPHRRRDVVTCFKLLWRAIPTPYLPIADMQRSVDSGTIRELTEDDQVDEHAFWNETAAELFEGDFPREFTPRSLRHLCRYALRRRIRSPEKILKLHIPETLKHFLLLEF